LVLTPALIGCGAERRRHEPTIPMDFAAGSSGRLCQPEPTRR
jgi:hypothetical protein